MFNIEHFSDSVSIPCNKYPVTCELSYLEPSLIDINGATSELANPGRVILCQIIQYFWILTP